MRTELAGLSDDRQLLCFALALWNGRDPILKERLFGLTNSEGNHGEDVKDYYFYLDSTPTHSYMKYLFKYQHRPYPYEDLVSTNRRRNRLEFNGGPEATTLHILPTLWFRNTWLWSRTPSPKPRLKQLHERTISAFYHELGERYFYCDRAIPLLFTGTETNNERIFKVRIPLPT